MGGTGSRLASNAGARLGGGEGREDADSTETRSSASSASRFDCARRSHVEGKSAAPRISAGLLPSLYQQRVAQLGREAFTSPPPEPLDGTLRACIDVVYGGGREWAPHVRATVYADNVLETQMNVPVYATLLCTWGFPGFEDQVLTCKPVPGTDVASGRSSPNPFWSRRFIVEDGREVTYRDLLHQLLHWFVSLPDGDERKQLLVNMILQLHEACYNCIGRHKEVFEYCVYDLLDAESKAQGDDRDASTPTDAVLAGARWVVQRHAAMFLDRHKRNALHAAFLSPLKFLYQKQYEVFENLDSHGASFWVSVMTDCFFRGLEMPFESIVSLDKGWSWGAVDFLPLMRKSGAGGCISTAKGGDASTALERLSRVDDLGREWRSLTAGLQPPADVGGPGGYGTRFRGLPVVAGRHAFKAALGEARREGSTLNNRLRPYAARFASFMSLKVVYRRFLLTVLGSAAWDASIGPALSALSAEALGESLSPQDLRSRLCPEATDAGALEVCIHDFVALLKVAGVGWA